MTIIASLYGVGLLKGFLAGALGLLMGTIGMSTTGALRGTFGYYEFMDGIPVIPALIGLFAFSELLILMDQQYLADLQRLSSDQVRRLLRGMLEVVRHPIALFRSALLGVGIGALPGAGATVASLVSYNVGRNLAKRPERCGTGHPEGIIVAEGANSSSEGGATATMLVLGIPGGAATAMMLGAIILQGWVPGPRLVYDHKDVIYAVIVSQFFQSLALLPVGALIAYLFSKIVNVSLKFLVPILIVFTVAGTYASRSTLIDPGIMVAFGLLGWIMRRYHYPLIAIILGMICHIPRRICWSHSRCLSSHLRPVR